jgi:hypothetical protein
MPAVSQIHRWKSTSCSAFSPIPIHAGGVTDAPLAWRDETRAFIRANRSGALAEEMRPPSNDDARRAARSIERAS